MMMIDDYDGDDDDDNFVFCILHSICFLTNNLSLVIIMMPSNHMSGLLLLKMICY